MDFYPKPIDYTMSIFLTLEYGNHQYNCRHYINRKTNFRNCEIDI